MAEDPIGITVPDFAVLFYTKINVWVAELGAILRVLHACSAMWGGVMAAASQKEAEEFYVPEMAKAHQALSRKAYSRYLSIKRSWEFGKSAVGFGASGGVVSPRKQ